MHALELTSSADFLPVLGVIFLRHAANRFEAATHQIEADQAAGRMPRRNLLPADYLRRRALWLPEAARYDGIMQQAATSGSDLPRLVTEAKKARIRSSSPSRSRRCVMPMWAFGAKRNAPGTCAPHRSSVDAEGSRRYVLWASTVDSWVA